MNIKTRTVNFDITPGIETYVSKKTNSLSKFLDDSDSVLCEVELGKSVGNQKSGKIFKAEINLSTPGKNQFYAVAEADDLYAAIDEVRDEIEREIVSKKTKRATLFRRGAARVKALIKSVYPFNR